MYISFFRSYIELPNGLRVMLISSLKPGETPEPMEEAIADEIDESDHEDNLMCADEDSPKNRTRKVYIAISYLHLVCRCIMRKCWKLL